MDVISRKISQLVSKSMWHALFVSLTKCEIYSLCLKRLVVIVEKPLKENIGFDSVILR